MYLLRGSPDAPLLGPEPLAAVTEQSPTTCAGLPCDLEGGCGEGCAWSFSGFEAALRRAADDLSTLNGWNGAVGAGPRDAGQAMDRLAGLRPGAARAFAPPGAAPGGSALTPIGPVRPC
jgi:hypothetical protein